MGNLTKDEILEANNARQQALNSSRAAMTAVFREFENIDDRLRLDIDDCPASLWNQFVLLREKASQFNNEISRWSQHCSDVREALGGDND